MPQSLNTIAVIHVGRTNLPEDYERRLALRRAAILFVDFDLFPPRKVPRTHQKILASIRSVSVVSGLS